MKGKYIFNGQHFKSKKEVDDYIRKVKKELLEKERILIIRPEHERYNFLFEIINVHNEKDLKIGSGIEYFYFVNDKYGNDQLRIMHTDGTDIECSCSYSKITMKDKQQQKLNSALRHSINDQIQEFKENKELKCATCGDTDKCEVDHIIPFHILRDNFIKTFDPLRIPTEFNDDTTGKAIFKEKDLQFENEWQQYHRQNATYQILCKTCNRIKSGKCETI
jgi:hypothetical protein